MQQAAPTLPPPCDRLLEGRDIWRSELERFYEARLLENEWLVDNGARSQIGAHARLWSTDKHREWILNGLTALRDEADKRFSELNDGKRTHEEAVREMVGNGRGIIPVLGYWCALLHLLEQGPAERVNPPFELAYVATWIQPGDRELLASTSRGSATIGHAAGREHDPFYGIQPRGRHLDLTAARMRPRIPFFRGAATGLGRGGGHRYHITSS